MSTKNSDLDEITKEERFISENIKEGSPVTEALKELAFELSTNYCTTSFGDLEREQVFLKDIFEESSICRKKLDADGNGTVSKIQRHRNILVIGAGASHDSYKCLPLGKKMIEDLKENYLPKIYQFEALKTKYEKRLEDMRLEKGVSELDFESYMSLFSELILTPEEVRNFLYERTKFRESPSLFYEVAAHMFKHSFIDVIINFNFDELLDHAIEEELGKNNYKYILSDGDCFEMKEAMVDGRIKTPIYIKPHGTISQKSSLRFTKTQYLEMSNEMKVLITDLVNGYRGDDIELINKVNLICVGYNMESIEFKRILEKELPHESKIFHFVCVGSHEKEDGYVQSTLKGFYNRVKDDFIKNKPKSFGDAREKYLCDKTAEIDLSKEIYKRINIFGFNKNKEKNYLTSPFSELFCLLWRYTENQFKKSYVPRSISRHEVISYLFYDSNFIYCEQEKKESYTRKDLKENFEKRTTYFRDRIIIEIAIAINRNKGVVDIVELLEDRAGSYYEKYYNCYNNSKGKKRGSRLLTFYDFISFFIDNSKEVSLNDNNALSEHGVSEQKEQDNSKQSKSYISNSVLYSRNIFKLKTLSKERLIEKLKDLKIRRNYSIINVKKQDVTENEYFTIEDSIIDELTRLITEAHVFDEENDVFDEENNVTRKLIYNDVTPTLIYYILKCPIISSQFLVNFKRNYNLPCYNGKRINEDKGNSEPKLMLEELCRLLNKSTRNHYYQIKPKYFDKKNFSIESYTKRKILHTNLSLDYEMRKLIGSNKWDRVLTISEVGSYFHYLRHSREEKPIHGLFNSKDKRIIMINSLDAINTTFNKGTTMFEKINSNAENIFKELGEYSGDFIKTYVIPFWQHNHHMMLLIKKVDSLSNQLKTEYPYFEIDGEKGFVMIGSFYMYRHGFSNHINPVYIGSDPYGRDVKHIENDFHRLLSLFFMNYQRACAFENLDEMKGIQDLSFNINSYEDWMDNDKFKDSLKKFMLKIVW